ncbi:transcriptional regulator NrdR [Candidatus Woesebacteria bacterium RIFOXYC1_FULL_31_51]|jgi:transcriptional repressor NrdR|uniref:Transcriptional repressor NrdR n=1 Tax=Candidatus Woesebacteria bacterium GW2011_GWC2_31_9 TaxID=1618586 RepID=A0A0F9YZB7_9BACT|nr:MAG: transcriptional regulator NrdR [Candidatus Woesebacteria bacterium GW2011_GWF1_31_35]KKP23138.1 MAG: Transcriptional repressor NrdR [Candidatus Woesebacteria bacterium GW2011_GWC1_30_29]KKP26826.1 MAG: Transcriptional repressor NrdR [Candidatus Woesebacteria bacterium GW2011_GWD1_31_12]KKP27401.1 MAG: Transcriptional repressor NrdR [Candidatus Woesebacteria bacterium GW2011_GWB1_31_29]KKP31357.1 MAG: Transcriptional repressor NrdR [Candidatus Woesebacteria bacterium GW2011_GWE2_31_6]KK
MNCPFCNTNDTQVLESRVTDDGQSLRRRRECSKCGKRFTTHESVKQSVLWVIKKDGRREPFDREKVKRGVLRSIEKRPVSLELINEIVDEVEREMLKAEKEEISSKTIGNAVLKRLKKIDKVAWLRFASVYLEFEDLTDFEKLIEKNS